VTYTASGFAPGSTVTFQYNPVLGTAAANQSGIAVIVAPGMPHPGSYTVTASAADGRRAATVVTVVALTTSAPTLPPSSPAPTTTQASGVVLPEPTTTSTVDPAAVPSTVSGLLPTTGSDSSSKVKWILALIALGLGLLAAARRRPATIASDEEQWDEEP
jgi:MYXO-CTERM domain-containing protein